ncbi:GTP-binding protein Rhes [Amphibalanus amphitrite]|uniref:GTP-binding protein Rhes n=1 Tax=Amphibalanus amphitrite TaxID=1232801 RepID=A0A6A4VFW7_AMPAM|nr:GTP-binding protein Rhes [Amphibalanus amphitrite]
MTTCGLCTPPLFTMRPRLERRRLSLQPELAAGADRGDGALSRRRTAPALEPSLEQDEEEEKKEQKYRVVVMGSARVGKTALISQFLYDTFTPRYVKTVEDLHNGEYEVHGRTLKLEILDTSGSYQFPAMRKLSIRTADGFVLVYAIDDEDSFEQVRQLREEILEEKPSGVPIVVVANKCDLASRRQVPETQGSLVELEWDHGFVQTSAKENINIVQVFKELLSQAKVRYDLSPAVEKRRQSLPAAQLSANQLKHLQSISRKHNSKRSSCIIA